MVLHWTNKTYLHLQSCILLHTCIFKFKSNNIRQITSSKYPNEILINWYIEIKVNIVYIHAKCSNGLPLVSQCAQFIGNYNMILRDKTHLKKMSLPTMKSLSNLHQTFFWRNTCMYSILPRVILKNKRYIKWPINFLYICDIIESMTIVIFTHVIV